MCPTNGQCRDAGTHYLLTELSYEGKGLFSPGWKVLQQLLHNLIKLFLVFFWILAWIKRLRRQTDPNRLLRGRVIDVQH